MYVIGVPCTRNRSRVADVMFGSLIHYTIGSSHAVDGIYLSITFSPFLTKFLHWCHDIITSEDSSPEVASSPDDWSLADWLLSSLVMTENRPWYALRCVGEEPLGPLCPSLGLPNMKAFQISNQIYSYIMHQDFVMILFQRKKSRPPGPLKNHFLNQTLFFYNVAYSIRKNIVRIVWINFFFN